MGTGAAIQLLLLHSMEQRVVVGRVVPLRRHHAVCNCTHLLQRMGAYRCVLTHFSQRYPKWPEGLPQGTPEGGDSGEGEPPPAPSTAVAFDGMRIPLALLPALPKLMPAVQAALADVDEEEAEEVEEEAGGVIV